MLSFGRRAFTTDDCLCTELLATISQGAFNVVLGSSHKNETFISRGADGSYTFRDPGKSVTSHLLQVDGKPRFYAGRSCVDRAELVLIEHLPMQSVLPLLLLSHSREREEAARKVAQQLIRSGVPARCIIRCVSDGEEYFATGADGAYVCGVFGNRRELNGLEAVYVYGDRMREMGATHVMCIGDAVSAHPSFWGRAVRAASLGVDVVQPGPPPQYNLDMLSIAFVLRCRDWWETVRGCLVDDKWLYCAYEHEQNQGYKMHIKRYAGTAADMHIPKYHVFDYSTGDCQRSMFNIPAWELSQSSAAWDVQARSNYSNYLMDRFRK